MTNKSSLDENRYTVTWNIAVKNGMPFLTETLASIASQTFKDFEVLAWDNGSDDGTVEELRKWIPDRIPGRVFADNPLPLALSRAALIDASQSEYVAILDADDIAYPNRLAEQVAFLNEHHDHAVVGSQIRLINQYGKPVPSSQPYPTNNAEIVFAFLTYNVIAQPAVLLRRNHILEAGNYEPVGAINVEDYDLWLRVASKRFKIANIDKILTDYRLHPKSTTQIALSENKLGQAMLDRFLLRGPGLYGQSRESLANLRNRSYSFGYPYIAKIAEHLSPIVGMSRKAVLSNNVFRKNANIFLRPADAPSRFALLSQAGDIQAAKKELLHIGVSLTRKLPIYNALREIYRSRTARKTLDQQRKRVTDYSVNGASVHPSIEIFGAEDTNLKIGSYAHIERDVCFWLSPDDGADPRVTIAGTVFIGRFTYIGAYQPISIGEHSMVGAFCYIISGNHDHRRRDIPLMHQGFVGAPITIEDDVWLGTHVVVLPGVTIGKGAIVAAGAVVTKSIPSYEIWGGTPAKFIKVRPGGDSDLSEFLNAPLEDILPIRS